MFTFEEVRELVVLVFWLGVTYKFICAVIAGVTKRLIAVAAKHVDEYEKQQAKPQQEDPVKRLNHDRTIGFKSN